MVKIDSDAAKDLEALIKRLEKKYGSSVEEQPARDPIAELVHAFLTLETNLKNADRAMEKLMAVAVDYNDLRVMQAVEVLDLLGGNYPKSNERVARMKETMHEIYVREHATEMKSIASKGKKDQRQYLDTLPGIVPYVAARVVLLSFGGHAMPVDEKLAALLAVEGVIPPDTDPGEAEAALLKQVKAADAVTTHLLFQAWSDDSKLPTRTALAEASPETPAKTTSKKTTKKSAAKKKTTKKKVAKKKPTKKKTTKKK